MAEVRLECSDCGSADVAYDDELGDAAPLTCTECGIALDLTWGEAQQKLLEAGKKFIDDSVRNAFKGTRWKIS